MLPDFDLRPDLEETLVLDRREVEAIVVAGYSKCLWCRKSHTNEHAYCSSTCHWQHQLRIDAMFAAERAFRGPQT